FPGREALVQVARSLELLDHVAVDLSALRLAVRPVRTTDVDALVPVDAQPAQTVEQLLVALLAVARRIGVLDAEHELAAGVPRVGPIEQGGADEADVGSAGRRRAEPHSDIRAGGAG